jgi:RNase H-like domain found in reverse transcriptase
MTPYYRRLIPGRAARCKVLLTALREDGTFEWTSKHQDAFDFLRHAILNNVVHGGDDARQYHLSTDASKEGMGGVLFQLLGVPVGTVAASKYRPDERIICFISQRFAPAETRYSTTEREALAVVRCLREVRHRVLGSPHPLMLYTDHQALSSILMADSEGGHGRIARWQDKIQEFTLEIHHVPGKELVIADGMSRLPTRLMDPPSDVDELFSFVVEADGNGGYARYLSSEWYGDWVRYKLSGEENMALNRSERRRLCWMRKEVCIIGKGMEVCQSVCCLATWTVSWSLRTIFTAISPPR